MKKVIAFAVAFALLIACAGCGNKEQINSSTDSSQATVDTSQADTYIEMAQGFIDDGDYDAAADVLQRGYSETGDERIVIMLAEVLSNVSEDSTPSQEDEVPSTDAEDNTTDDSSKSVSLMDYEGVWANESICWAEGGLYVDIYRLEGEMVSGMWYYVDITSVQSGPGCRTACISSEYDTAEIQGDTLFIDFEDDWGNRGTVVLQFTDEDSIVCKVTDFVGDPYASWGLFEGEWVLFRNDDVYELLQEPTNDTSEGNNGNMSIEEMKQNCYIFEWDWSADFANNSTLSPCTRSDLLNNPEAYINMLFVPCETLTQFIVCPDCQGSGFKYGIADKGKCYNKGYRSIDKTENNIHYILQEYPEQAMYKAISISKINTDVNGTLIYEHQYNEGLIGTDYIYDLRDDKSIKITENSVFVPYMVFLGKVDGSLKFGMFACDII